MSEGREYGFETCPHCGSACRFIDVRGAFNTEEGYHEADCGFSPDQDTERPEACKIIERLRERIEHLQREVGRLGNTGELL